MTPLWGNNLDGISQGQSLDGLGVFGTTESRALLQTKSKRSVTGNAEITKDKSRSVRFLGAAQGQREDDNR